MDFMLCFTLPCKTITKMEAKQAALHENMWSKAAIRIEGCGQVF